MTTNTIATAAATDTGSPRASSPRGAGGAGAAGGHPLLAALEQLEATSAGMAGHADAWGGLETLTIRQACTRIRKVRARLDGQVIAATRALEAAGAAAKAGATSTGAMLAQDYGGNRRETDTLVRTGDVITRAKARATERDLLTGALTPEQARIISTGLLTLPAGTPEADRARCEQALVNQAPHLSLPELRRAADRVNTPIADPSTVDATENLSVTRRERSAWQRTELSMAPQGDGTTTGRFRIPDAQAAMLTTLLQAQSAPRRTHLLADTEAGIDPDQSENRTYPQRLGQAFCALIEHVPTTGWATAGGSAATLVITLDLPTLRAGLDQKVARHSDHATISAEQARRLACEHRIIPHVLGGTSLPLDIGSHRRLFPSSIRKALTARDRGCAFPGCDRPPHWCEAHHITPVSAGGPTTTTNGVLLCAHHHRYIHEHNWDIRIHPNGYAQFKPPGTTTWHTHNRYRHQHHPAPPPDRAQPPPWGGTQPPPRGHHHAHPADHDHQTPSGGHPEYLLPVEPPT